LVTLGGAALMAPAPGDESALLLGPGKPLALLAYLAFSPGRAASREHLVDLLWSDVDPKAGNHTFRQTVWYLKQRLGEDAFCSRDSNLVLAAPIESDRDEFLAAIEQGHLDRAVKLYAGDFLPGFAAPGGADFEHWADVERHRMRLMFARAAEALVRRQLSSGHARDALRLARRVRDLDPEDEGGWRLVLESVLSANDAVAGTVEADALEHLLAADERELEPATRTLLEVIRQGPPPERGPSGARPLVAELVGREREFSSIIAAWDTARRGPGRHVHVTAAAGLGKTRLLSELHARLRATGSRAVFVRANAGERHVAFAFASDLAARLCTLPGAAAVSPAGADALVALNPSLSSRFLAARADRATEEEALRRRAIAVCEVIAAVADEAPIALLIDDVQWADGASRQVIQTMVERVADSRVLIVTAARPVVEGRVETRGTAAMTLDVLSPAQVAALVSSLGSLPEALWSAGFTDRLHAAAGGSPLLTLGTLQLLSERGVLMLDEQGWECPSPVALAAELGQGSALANRIARLERTQRWILLLLAAAGTPLAFETLREASGSAEDAVQADLGSMEQRGLVVRAGGDWEPGHDEIAAIALEAAGEDARRAAHEALGKALDTPGADVEQLLRAGQHAAAAGDQDELERLFPRVVRAARRRGDRRPLSQLAVQLLGEGASTEGARRLVRHLPVHIRAGLTSRSRVGALVGAVTAAVLVPFVIVSRTPPPFPDAVLIVAEKEPHGSVRAYRVELKREGWPPSPALDVTAIGSPYRMSFPEIAFDATPSPDGRQWVFRREMADSGGNELFLAGPRGSIHRLTYRRGDDMTADWSPDARQVVFSTTRWNAHAWADLATLDLASGRARQLTGGDEVDTYATWSPDGTRIAFSRLDDQAHGGTSRHACWVGVVGGEVRCSHAADRWAGVLAWYDAREIVAEIDTAGERALVRLNVDTDQMHIVTVDSVAGFRVSRDGRWVACYCQAKGQTRGEWYVFPIDNPDRKSRIALGPEDASRYTLQWVPNGRPPSPLERLVVTQPRAAIPVGTTHGLVATGYGATGGEIPLRHLTWWSSDTAVATANESTGVVQPRRTGSVMIHVSAGGWRGTWARLRVGEPLTRTVFGESWAGSLEAEWIPFGVPVPRLMTGPGGIRGFLNNGDGTFLSGAYSRRQFDGARGLAMEARLSTPLNTVQYQSVGIELTPQSDSAALAAWDHRTGNPPVMGHRCGAIYPEGDGDPASVPFSAAGHLLVPGLSWMRSGSWYTVRIQLFPDGSCGVALNGRPVWRTGAADPSDKPFRVSLWGSSLGSNMLVGPLEVWEGVRGDIDWREVDAPGAAARALNTPPRPYPVRTARAR
jgi:DNA-binding SARP family transcriptional activator